MSAIKIGQIIYNNIIADSDLSKAFDGRIYPIQAPLNTSSPFVVYSRVNAYIETSTKDGYLNDSTSFQITVVSDDYFESVDLADSIRDRFDGCAVSYSYIAAENIRLTSCSESIIDDKYVQNLNFDCEVNY